MILVGSTVFFFFLILLINTLLVKIVAFNMRLQEVVLRNYFFLGGKKLQTEACECLCLR